MKNACVHNTNQSKWTLGQIGFYIAAVLRMQFCVYLFSVLICSEYAWLMCWHHGMALVTRSFKCQDIHSPLTKFIWYYSLTWPYPAGSWSHCYSMEWIWSMQLVSRLLMLNLIFIFISYFIFLLFFLLLEQLGLGVISHAVTSVTTWWHSHKTDHGI